jgi:site-specific DNA recombinase
VAAVNNRAVALQTELANAEQKLKRLYDSIAKGILELDDLLAEQVTLLKAERERAKAALDHTLSQRAGAIAIDLAKVDAFSRLMTDLLAQGNTPALKAYLRSILGAVEVGDKTIRIMGSKKVLAGAVTGKNFARQNVRGLG